MTSSILAPIIQTLFTLRGRERALRMAAEQLEVYLDLAEGLSPEQGRAAVEVPAMLGVDEDMRRWSFYMLLEHNAIVNRGITAVIAQLVRGEPLHGPALINPKTDVMPSPEAGPEQVEAFEASVRDHIQTVQSLGRLRGTPTLPHPIFGNFDAHKWNCMFALHLKIHNRQAEQITSSLSDLKFRSENSAD